MGNISRQERNSSPIRTSLQHPICPGNEHRNRKEEMMKKVWSLLISVGMYFSYAMSQISGWRDVVDEKDFYNDFWDVLDNILNSILFVLIGLSILYIPSVDSIIWLCLAAVILNLLCRFVGVLISSLIIKRVPNHYSKLEFTSLLTWTGLKGGLSLALALTTREYLSIDAYNVVLIMTFVTIFFTIICTPIN